MSPRELPAPSIVASSASRAVSEPVRPSQNRAPRLIAHGWSPRSTVISACSLPASSCDNAITIPEAMRLRRPDSGAPEVPAVAA